MQKIQVTFTAHILQQQNP